MSDSRKKYDPKLFHLAPHHIQFILSEAQKRNPNKNGTREQSGVVRDALDFTSEHYPLFLSWIAARGTSAVE